MKTLLAVLLLSALAFAGDKKPEKPSLTSEQKLAIVTAQRDAYLAALQAFEPNMKVQQAQAQIESAVNAAQVGVDLSKWKLNPRTLEFDPVPQQAEVKPNEEKKP